MPDLKKYYTVDEISPGLLRGIQRRVEPKQRRILDFAGVRTHSEMIRRRIFIDDPRKLADLRAYTDPSVKMQGLETERQVVDPFHLKNHFEFDLESEFTRKRGGEIEIASEGLVHSEQNVLEPARRNMYVYALLEMLNTQTFAYDDPDKGELVLDYSDHIGALPDPANKLGSNSFDAYAYTRTMKQNFYDMTGMIPDLAFMNPSVANPFINLDKVAAKYEPQAPRDPDPSGETFEEFTFNGIRFIVLYDQYPDQSGTLQPAIKNKHMAVTVSEVEGQSGANQNPFIFDKMENDENEGDADQPFYEVKEIDNDPPKAGNFMYDNLVPGVSKKKIAAMWEVQQ
ncbi:MAG: major capsid protein [Bradymonadaceae bacterium]